jgi:hypothetical protein
VLEDVNLTCFAFPGPVAFNAIVHDMDNGVYICKYTSVMCGDFYVSVRNNSRLLPGWVSIFASQHDTTSEVKFVVLNPFSSLPILLTAVPFAMVF